MYVVRREYRGFTGHFTVGSVIEPTDVRNFEYLVLNKYIVEVDEHNFEEYDNFFQRRFGVALPVIPEIEAKHKELVDIQESFKADLAVRVEALQLDLPEDLTIEEVLLAVENAEVDAKEAADAKAEADKLAKVIEESIPVIKEVAVKAVTAIVK